MNKVNQTITHTRNHIMKKLLALIIALFMVGTAYVPAEAAESFKLFGRSKKTGANGAYRTKKTKTSKRTLRQTRQLKRRYTKAHYPGHLRK